jgi:hypothetical protein
MSVIATKPCFDFAGGPDAGILPCQTDGAFSGKVECLELLEGGCWSKCVMGKLHPLYEDWKSSKKAVSK